MRKASVPDRARGGQPINVRLFDPDGGGDSPLTVGQIVTLYLTHSAAENRHGPQARADREQVLGLFVAEFGDLGVDDCRPFHLTDWVLRHPRWKSTATRRSRSNAVRSCFQWAADQERIPRNPFKSVRYAEAERRPEMPDEIFEQACAAAHKRFELVLRFLRLTGCRLSELCRCRWEDMDADRGAWTIHIHKSRKITGKPKVIALTTDAVGLLRRSAGSEALPMSGVAFLNTRNRPWRKNALCRQWSRLKERNKLNTNASLHGIRHRFAGQAVANGASIKLLSMQLGHASQAVTERYYVAVSDRLDEIRQAAALAAMPPRKPPPPAQPSSG